MAWSALFDDVHSGGHSLLVDNNPVGRQISRALRRRSSTVIREVIDTVVATTSINGGTAVTYPRIGHTVDPGESVVQGGVRSIDTVTKIAASSTISAAQAAEVDSLVDYKSAPSTYPTDASGNGGGGEQTKTYAVS